VLFQEILKYFKTSNNTELLNNSNTDITNDKNDEESTSSHKVLSTINSG
jgi:hypothetical protein